MGDQTLSKRLIFNEKIDADYLFSLYADDFVCIEEIFCSTLDNFDADLESIQLAYANQDIQDLRKAVHKIKPVFGFVGMLSLQQACKELEDLCTSAPPFEEISQSYKAILADLLDAKSILEQDYRKLKEFNGSVI
jgi:HPt (histidine-containing phosphotransfer) domain-containing protein